MRQNVRKNRETGGGGRGASNQLRGREVPGFIQAHPVEAGIESRIPGPATGIETSHVRGRMNGKFTQRIKWIINFNSVALNEHQPSDSRQRWPADTIARMRVTYFPHEFTERSTPSLSFTLQPSTMTMLWLGPFQWLQPLLREYVDPWLDCGREFGNPLFFRFSSKVPILIHSAATAIFPYPA